MKRSLTLFLVVAMIPWVLASPSFAMTIFEAAQNGHVRVVLSLIHEDPTNRDAVDDHGSTPLHYAARYERLDVVRALIGLGARVNARNRSGSTPLHCAAWADNKGVVEELTAQGAIVEVFDEQELSPLVLSILFNRAKTAQALIAAGAEVTGYNPEGYPTFLSLAKASGADTIVASLQPAARAKAQTVEAFRLTGLGKHAFAARIHSIAAETYQTSGNDEEAIASYIRAAASYLADGSAQSYLKAAQIYTQIGNHEAAVRSYFEASSYSDAAGSYRAIFRGLVSRVDLVPMDRIAAMNSAEASAISAFEAAAVHVDALLESASRHESPEVGVLRARAVQIQETLSQVLSDAAEALEEVKVLALDAE